MGDELEGAGFGFDNRAGLGDVDGLVGVEDDSGSVGVILKD